MNTKPVFSEANRLSIEQVHLLDLELIEEVHSYCCTHQLRYTLAYGTLLGAIRHHGFIPWDDDADLWMPRDDFDRFLSSYENKAHYELIKPYSDPYAFGWAKLIDTRTAYYNETRILPDSYGLSIDIFPLDADPGPRIYKLVSFQNKLRSLSKHKTRVASVSLDNSIRDFLHGIAQLIPQSIYGAAAQKRLISNEAEPTHVVNLFSPYGYTIEKMPATWFDETMLASFENKQFFIPTQYEIILEKIYGSNWMVPIERAPHASFYWRKRKDAPPPIMLVRIAERIHWTVVRWRYGSSVTSRNLVRVKEKNVATLCSRLGYLSLSHGTFTQSSSLRVCLFVFIPHSSWQLVNNVTTSSVPRDYFPQDADYFMKVA